MAVAVVYLLGERLTRSRWFTSAPEYKSIATVASCIMCTAIIRALLPFYI